MSLDANDGIDPILSRSYAGCSGQQWKEGQHCIIMGGVTIKTSVFSAWSSKKCSAKNSLMVFRRSRSLGSLKVSVDLVEKWIRISSANKWQEILQHFVICPKGSKYKENNNGPKTEPCGTLQDSGDDP